ncbi:MAG: hypothetical protein D6743_19355 [Calditrichaeota bacterium]|nr:MAG: hypothetical protein D6743_19355 [Calditrichota bacterium]
MVVVEETLSEQAEIIWRAARRICKNAVFLKFSNASANGCHLPVQVEAALACSHCGILLTTTCVEEKQLNAARQKDSRVLVVQNATQALLERAFDTNYRKISNITRKLVDLFSISKTLQITSASGTDVRLSIQRCKRVAQTGLAHAACDLAFLPAGEASLLLRSNVDGQIVLDRIAGQRKKLSKPIHLKVSKGHITQIKGESEAEALRKQLRKFGKHAREIRELGVGTNHEVTFGNSAQEDEKVLGSIHISFGENHITQAKGRILQAVKGVVLKPTLSIDGKVIIDRGTILV